MREENSAREESGFIEGLTPKNFNQLYCSWTAYQDRIYDLTTALAAIYDPERLFTRNIISQIKLLKKFQEANELSSDRRLKIMMSRSKINRSDEQAKQIISSIVDLMTHILVHPKDQLGDYRKLVPNFDELVQVPFRREPVNKDLLAQRAYRAYLDEQISESDFIAFMNRKDMKGAKYDRKS